MKKRRLAVGALFLFLLIAAAFVLSDRLRRPPTPASPAVLENIADRNEEAAAEAAANQRQESENLAEVADMEADAADVEDQPTNLN